MSYRICKTFEIESGHALSKHPHKCRFPHGHTRKIECILEANQLDENEMVCDFQIIKQVLQDYLDTMDHALCLNTDDPNYQNLQKAYGERIIGLQSQDPTTEVLAQLIYEELDRQLKQYGSQSNPDYPLRQAVSIKRVRVWETSTSWAEYSL